MQKSGILVELRDCQVISILTYVINVAAARQSEDNGTDYAKKTNTIILYLHFAMLTVSPSGTEAFQCLYFLHTHLVHERAIIKRDGGMGWNVLELGQCEGGGI